MRGVVGATTFGTKCFLFANSVLLVLVAVCGDSDKMVMCTPPAFCKKVVATTFMFVCFLQNDTRSSSMEG